MRRDGLRAATLALAGSTRRSADPAVDDHLGEQLLRSGKDREEQAIVTRRIVRALRPPRVWVAAPDEPALVKVANIQHLATPIRAQLARPVSAIELAGLLHPTPAVGGEPFAAAEPLIPALEGLDRGWYAGPVGWTDADEDGEFCVALRCALLRGARPAATPASASSATPIRRPSSPRPRSSSARCSRCSRSDLGPDALAHRAGLPARRPRRPARVLGPGAVETQSMLDRIARRTTAAAAAT